MKTSSSMVTPSQIKVWLEILQLASDVGILLDLDKSAHLGVVANGAAVEVDELGEFDSLAKFDVRGNGTEFIHENTPS